VLTIPKEVKQTLKDTALPIPKKMIKKAYIFGSSIQGIEYNDIDIAFMVDPLSPIFQNQLTIFQLDVDNVQYHILPDYPWFKQRLDSSSVNMVLKKKYLSDKLYKNSILHQLGFRGFIHTFSKKGTK
jgi:hypothetical protein